MPLCKSALQDIIQGLYDRDDQKMLGRKFTTLAIGGKGNLSPNNGAEANNEKGK